MVGLTREMLSNFEDTFTYCYKEEEEFIFPITIHPDVSGRPHVLLMLESLYVIWSFLFGYLLVVILYNGNVSLIGSTRIITFIGFP